MLRLWIAILLLFGGCTSGPQAEASESNIAAQGKAIEQAADAMVNEAVLEFEVADTPENDEVATSASNVSNVIKSASQ